MRHNILRLFFFIGVLLIIWFSLYVEAERFQGLGGDKLWHVLAFGFLGLTSALACPNRRRLAIIVAGLVVFGLGIEFVQFITPGRSADLIDVIANLVGLSAGLTLAVIARLLKIRRNGTAS